MFTMSSDASKSTVITVMAANVKCTTVAQFVEFTASSLVTLGVVSNPSIVLAPDWYLVAGLLFGKYCRLSYVSLLCIALLFFAFLCFALLCFALLCYAVVCLALPCPALPGLALPCFPFHCLALVCVQLRYDQENNFDFQAYRMLVLLSSCFE